MSAEQWIGVLCVAIGAYLAICSIWCRDFILYKLKAAQAQSIFGEAAANRFFAVLGVVLMLGGILKAAGVF